MNDGTSTTPPVEKLKRKRKAEVPRAPRVIDPGIKSIREEAARKVREYHASKDSGRILNNITGKLIPRLMTHDRIALKEFLSQPQ